MKAAFALLLLTVGASAQFVFVVQQGAITITGYTGQGGDVTVPAQTNGLPVVRLGPWAFTDCINVVSVRIPASVAAIGIYCFSDCGPGLASVRFEGNAPTEETVVPDQHTMFAGSDKVVVYRLAGASGWGESYAGRPTAIWEVAQPRPTITQPRFDTEGFSFTVTGASNQVAVVESSEDFQNWTALSTNSLPFRFTDAETCPRRFYRTR